MTLATATLPVPTVDRPIVSAPLAVAPGPTLAEREVCDVCEHPRSDHDMIARRYCNATFSNALTRGCICPMPSP